MNIFGGSERYIKWYLGIWDFGRKEIKIDTRFSFFFFSLSINFRSLEGNVYIFFVWRIYLDLFFLQKQLPE